MRRDVYGLPVPAACECGEPLVPQVMHSAAGYYIGTWCKHCGPYSRESGYHQAPEDAEKEMPKWK
jgi:hypothetical protein